MRGSRIAVRPELCRAGVRETSKVLDKAGPFQETVGWGQRFVMNGAFGISMLDICPILVNDGNECLATESSRMLICPAILI
jgi:hypothetical protein